MNAISIIDKYYKEGSKAKNVLITHSNMVKTKALSVLSKHPELMADRELIEQAAMLHDIGMVFTNAPKIGCTGKWPYIAHGHLGAEVLRKEGHPILARFCERHTGTGITREEVVNNNLPIPPGNYVPETLEEIIVCYADKFYSKGELEEELKIEQIIHNIARYGDHKVETFLSWHEQFK